MVFRLACGALAVGYGYFRLYLELAEVRRADWWEELVNYQQHSILALDAIPSVAALAGLAFAGYLVLRFVPPERQPPLVCVLALAAAYCGVGLCVLWCVQTACRCDVSRGPLCWPGGCVCPGWPCWRSCPCWGCWRGC